MEEKTPKPWTKDNVRDKIIKYCLYQERCTQEVYDKLRSHRIYDPLRQQVIDELIEEGYLNDERYVTAIVRGKSNRLKWGEIKIRNFLAGKNIPKSLINVVMCNEIDEAEKTDQITALIERKLKGLRTPADFQTKNKINAFLMRKGYSFEQIGRAWSVLEKNKNTN